MERLRQRREEAELRRRWDVLADRCACIALLEILVAEDRTDDLRALADSGDYRSGHSDEDARRPTA